MLGVAFCYVYVYNFFQTWFHTFLVRGRGFSEAGLLLSALPFVVAACANLAAAPPATRWCGGSARSAAGDSSAPRALTAAAAFTVAAMLTQHQVLTVVFLALTYGAITFQQSGVFGVCLDIGGPRAGAMVGLMNTVAQVGGLVGSVLYGYIVDRCRQLRRAVHPDGGAAAHRRPAVGESRCVREGRAGREAPLVADPRRCPQPDLRHKLTSSRRLLFL